MTLFHGTKHPYRAGDDLISGGVVRWCDEHMEDDAEPVAGCGCDLREMIWATPDLRVAVHAANNRVCQCSDPYSDAHRARVFEVDLVEPEPDTNDYSEGTVMALSGVVVAELPADNWDDL